MENKHKCSAGGNFSNGFLLGVVVGAIIVFLLATKKGKKIIQTLTENGFEGVSDLTDMLLDEDEELEEEEYAAEGPSPVSSASVHKEQKAVVKSSHPVKRFFKRGKK
jgi:gas vesicle protein